MKDSYKGTVKTPQYEEVPVYEIDGLPFEGKLKACRFLQTNAEFTLQEALQYLTLLGQDSPQFSPVSPQERFIQRKLVQAS
jgi:hypothetical protein